MTFMTWIVDRLNDASDFFHQLYLECYFSELPIGFLAEWFLRLRDIFNELAWDVSDFFSWLLIKADEWDQVLSWSTIWSYILSYVPNLEEIRDWFYNWADWVWSEIETWWTSTSSSVLSWIDSAVAAVQVQISAVSSRLDGIQAFIDELEIDFPDVSAILDWFTDWPGHVLSVVDTWWTSAMVEVQGLINSAFIEREPFWAGWQDIRTDVLNFFADPEDWLYKRLDSFFERFW